MIDTEIFVNCQFGYDIQCQVVGEEGTANLPDPAAVPLRLKAQASTAILMDWKLGAMLASAVLALGFATLASAVDGR